MTVFESAIFGNRGGSHQLLESSLPTSAPVLESLRFLVDRPAGHVGPEVRWSPYWGCQAVDGWWALWRGEEDNDAPRRNMVIARVALIPSDACGSVDDLNELLASVGYDNTDSRATDLALAGAIFDCLARGKAHPVVPDLSCPPRLLRTFWPRLWPSARVALSLRTLFGTEGLEAVCASSIVVIPSELKPRWRGRYLIEEKGGELGAAGQWFRGNSSPRITQVIADNKDRLPADYGILERVARVAERLEWHHMGTGTPGDALVVVRTQESFPNGLTLSSEDIALVRSALMRLGEASIQDVRAASLVSLRQIGDLTQIESALATWIENRLPEASPPDALWVLDQAAGKDHAPWWRRAVEAGVRAACQSRSSQWANAIWKWWLARPDSAALLTQYMKDTPATEEWLATSAPKNLGDELVEAVSVICREREWPTLLARALGPPRPLPDSVGRLRANLLNPEAGLHVLLRKRSASEVVDAAIATAWTPLMDRAIDHTVAEPALLARVVSGDPLPLVSRHLSCGGAFPAELVRHDFLARVFDGAAAPTSNEDCLTILKRLDRRAGRILLDHPNADKLFPLNAELAQGGIEEWWHRFLHQDTEERPPSALVTEALQFARVETRGQPVRLVIGLLRAFPELTEATLEEWMEHTGYLWEAGDHERVAEILLERRWSSAARKFRWSWKRELTLVAWHARELLSWFHRFATDTYPEGATLLAKKESAPMQKKVTVLFLAANPSSSLRLALDEEARAIEGKVRDAKHRDLVSIRTRWAVRPEDLQQALLDEEPTVVHFSGHGGGDVGIVLHAGNEGDEMLVAADALADLFRVLKTGIRVVVLNACYSEVQAQAIVKEIDFVVGMSDTIGDDAAKWFAAAFYRALAFGKSVRIAFELGLNEIKLMGLKEDQSVPQLFIRQGANLDTVLVTRVV